EPTGKTSLAPQLPIQASARAAGDAMPRIPAAAAATNSAQFDLKTCPPLRLLAIVVLANPTLNAGFSPCNWGASVGEECYSVPEAFTKSFICRRGNQGAPDRGRGAHCCASKIL